MAEYQSLGDEHLLTLIANGDKDALECVYNRYGTSVFSLARYMLREEAIAEEITQEVFITLWLKASTFNPQRGSPRAWLMSIAHNRVIDQLRSSKRARESSNRVASDLLALHTLSHVNTEDEAQRSLDREQVLKALTALPEEQRKVVIMAYFEGYSQSEIAKALDQPLGTVKTRLRLALQKLRATFTTR